MRGKEEGAKKSFNSCLEGFFGREEGWWGWIERLSPNGCQVLLLLRLQLLPFYQEQGGGGGRPKSPIFAVKGFAAGKVNGIPY